MFVVEQCRRLSSFVRLISFKAETLFWSYFFSVSFAHWNVQVRMYVPLLNLCVCVCVQWVCVLRSKGYSSRHAILQVTWAVHLLAAVHSHCLDHWKANERAIAYVHHTDYQNVSAFKSNLILATLFYIYSYSAVRKQKSTDARTIG